MKFKVGDIVRVRKDLVGNTRYNGLWFPMDMKKFRGLIFEVKSVVDDCDYNLKPISGVAYPRGIKSDIRWWCFNDAMLEEPYIMLLSEFIRKEVQCIK